MLLFSCIVLLVSFHHSRCYHAFQAPSHMEKFVQSDSLFNATKDFISKAEEKIEKLKRLSQELDVLWQTTNQTVLHPIAAYKMIAHLANITTVMADHTSIGDFYKIASNASVPTRSDVVGAGVAIDVVRQTFNMSHDDISNGTIQGDTVFPLLQDDMYIIGEGLFNGQNVKAATKWLERCIEAENQTMQPIVVYNVLVRCYELANDMVPFKRILGEIKKIHDTAKVDNSVYYNHLNNMFLNMVLPKEFPSSSDTPSYSKVCSRHIIQNIPDTRISPCRYVSTRLPYIRYKKETISQSPPVFIYHDVINENENTILTKLAKKALKMKDDREKKAVLANANPPKSIKIHFSHQTWMTGNDVLFKVTKRMEDITGLEATDHKLYKVGDFGVGGFDGIALESESVKLRHLKKANSSEISVNATVSNPVKSKPHGMATFALYLKTAVIGGSRAFIRSMFEVSGVRNGVMLWYNEKPSGDVEWSSMQGTCPVMLGSQLVMKKWFHSVDQTFKRPCNLKRFNTPRHSSISLSENRLF